MRPALVIVLSLLTLGADAPVEQSGDGTLENPFTIFASETCCIAWDVQATLIERVEIEFTKAADPFDPVQTLQVTRAGQELPWAAADGIEKVIVSSFVKTIPDGLYRFRVRVGTAAVVYSTWTEWKYAKKDWATPEPPGGCFMSWG
jgi:hypothetical protein